MGEEENVDMGSSPEEVTPEETLSDTPEAEGEAEETVE